MEMIRNNRIDVTHVRNVFEAMMAGSLGVRDSESCWFTEEISTYMCCWESPRDLPLVIEMFVSFLSLVEDHPSFLRTYVRTYYSCPANITNLQ